MLAEHEQAVAVPAAPVPVLESEAGQATKAVADRSRCQLKPDEGELLFRVRTRFIDGLCDRLF